MSTAGPKSSEWVRRLYVVPRQWSVGMLLMVTTLYAGLCASLKAVGAPVAVIVTISAFLLFVAIAQLILPQTPRFASACAGIVFCWAGYLVSMPKATMPPLYPDIVFMLVMSGGILGYLAGNILAGVFLVGDCCQRWWRKVSGRPAESRPRSAWQGRPRP